MTRFMACISVAILVYSLASRAESQEVKRLGVAAGTVAGEKVERGQGAAFVDLDNDGNLDLLVASGLPTHREGWGIAVGDFDNDGWPDLLVVDQVSRSKLYRNRGDGTFEEVAREPTIESIRIDGGKVEISGETIRVEGGKVEISGRRQMRIEGGRVEINGQSIRADGVKKMEIIRDTK